MTRLGELFVIQESVFLDMVLLTRLHNPICYVAIWVCRAASTCTLKFGKSQVLNSLESLTRSL